MVETSFEFAKSLGVLDQHILHLRRDLLVKAELFDDQVEVINKCLLCVLFNVVVQRRLNVVRTAGLLDLLDPHVEHV